MPNESVVTAAQTNEPSVVNIDQPKPVSDSVFSATVFGNGEVIEDNPFEPTPQAGVGESQPFAYPSMPPAPAQYPATGTPAVQPAAPQVQPAQQAQLPPEIQAELEQGRAIMPLVQFIRENPDIASMIEAKLTGRPSQAMPAAQAAPVAALPPEPPVKPAGYNPADAVQNPDSESWKYREAVEQYQLQVTNFVREEQLRQRAEQEAAVRQQQMRQQQAMRMRQIESEVMTKHGLTKEQATDFIARMSDPRSVSIANLVQLYMLQNGLKPSPPRQGAGAAPPLPGGMSGGQAVPAGVVTTIGDDWFTQAAKGWVKPR